MYISFNGKSIMSIETFIYEQRVLLQARFQAPGTLSHLVHF